MDEQNIQLVVNYCLGIALALVAFGGILLHKQVMMNRRNIVRLLNYITEISGRIPKN